MEGVVKFFNDEKGYGFITVQDDNSNMNGQDVFVHIKACKGGKITKGDEVSFNIEETKKGKSAIDVLKF